MEIGNQNGYKSQEVKSGQQRYQVIRVGLVRSKEKDLELTQLIPGNF